MMEGKAAYKKINLSQPECIRKKLYKLSCLDSVLETSTFKVSAQQKQNHKGLPAELTAELS
jgi:hypothetical protein